MDALKLAGSMLAVIVVLLLLVFGMQLAGFASFAFFAPKVVAVQTQTFKQSQAYTDGMANDLGDLRLQYLGAKTQEQKDAIRAVILQRYNSYNKDQLPPDLRQFYFSL